MKGALVIPLTWTEKVYASTRLEEKTKTKFANGGILM